jgi:hypothetical protein
VASYEPAGVRGLKKEKFLSIKIFPLTFLAFKFGYNFAKRLLDQAFVTARCCGKIRHFFWGVGGGGVEADNMEFDMKIKN